MRSSATSATAKAAARVVADKVSTSVKRSAVFQRVVVSAALQKFLGGQVETSRPESLKKLWEYVKTNNLQDPSNKRDIVCDETLKNLFGGKEQVRFLELPGLLNSHFPKKST